MQKYCINIFLLNAWRLFDGVHRRKLKNELQRNAEVITSYV